MLAGDYLKKLREHQPRGIKYYQLCIYNVLFSIRFSLGEFDRNDFMRSSKSIWYLQEK